jgi:hypothetical protein
MTKQAFRAKLEPCVLNQNSLDFFEFNNFRFKFVSSRLNPKKSFVLLIVLLFKFRILKYFNPKVFGFRARFSTTEKGNKSFINLTIL